MRYISKKMWSGKLSSSGKSVIFFICAGMFAGLFLKLFVIDILHVSGRSMEESIHDKSTVAVNKLHYGIVKPWSEHLILQWHKPKVNDVVIYLYNNKIVVKRVAATEGMLLEYSTNPLYTLQTGDKTIPLSETQYDALKNFTEVPSGYILAIGDNYAESIDSRDYGFVSNRNVLGKVICK